MSTAAVIREIRAAKGWSQERLAQEVRLTAKTIRNLEAGGGLRASTALKLSEALGVSLDELLLGEKASA